MNHKITDLAKLSADSKSLFDNVIKNTVDGDLLKNLKEGSDSLDKDWHGSDAKFNINNLVIVYNKVVEFRNYLAEMAEFTSGIAVYYNGIVAANGGNDYHLTKI